MRKVFLGCLVAVSVLRLPVEAKVGLARLTVEGRQAPVGLDIKNPRFGWQIVSDEKNVTQKTYRIVVASTKEKLDGDDGDVWDSGIVRSGDSQWVALPEGTRLQPGHRYFWKVAVSTNKGKLKWSEPAEWSTGLFCADNWKGQWIGLDSLMEWDSMERHSRLSSRCLRKSFSVKPVAVRRAMMYISGLGCYTLNINGRRIGDDVLTPLPTDYTKTVAYDAYDVTASLGKDNAIGVTLAGGHYFAQTQNYQTGTRTTYGLPRLLASLVIEYADGTSDTVATDTTWRMTADGPVRYANEYDGELYDANKVLRGWDCYGYDDSKWMAARKMEAPKGTLRGALSENMHVYQRERTLAIRRFGHRYIVDFGTNNAGRVRIRKAHVAKGDTVRIRHAELLEKGDSTLYVANLRSAEATAYYVADGNAVDWTPEFTFYGFRYVEVTGVDDLLPADIERELIADRMDDSNTGFAVTDRDGNDMLDRIVANARRGVRSNYKGMPIDCPQRDERMPWLGDRTTGCLGESYLVNHHALYAKWIGDMRDGQDSEGRISDVTPAYWRLYNTNVTWPAALPFSCDMMYRQYGDLRPMQDSYDAIVRFLKMIRSKNYKDGLIPYDRYGDWCVPPESLKLVHSKDPSRKTDGQLISSAYYYYLCRMMSRYAKLLGHEADAKYFADEAGVTLDAVNRTYLKDNGYDNATVTANLLPLAMGMVPKDKEPAVIENLISTIVGKNDTHISVGVIGIQWLMRFLSSIGRTDLAYQLATTDTYPGWGYMVKNGATTIWELWNGNTADPSMNSGNHVMLLGDLLPWCYECLGGIRPAMDRPGFKHSVIWPDFSEKRISGVEASHPTPYGVVKSNYVRRNGKLYWTVNIPANTTAEVHLPDGKVKHKGSGEWNFEIRE